MSSDERSPTGAPENSSEESRNEEHRDAMKARQAEHRAEVKKRSDRRGVILVHTGDGKGKSTSAFGVALRAAGHGQRVGLVQFIKGTWKTGEQAALKRFPEIEHVVAGDGFTWDTQDREQDLASTRQGWARAKAMMEATGEGAYEVVILDELNIALSYGYLPVEEVVPVLRAKREELSVVITGRGAPPELIEVADTVSEMRPIKHAWDAGIRARKGIEF